MPAWNCSRKNTSHWGVDLGSIGSWRIHVYLQSNGDSYPFIISRAMATMSTVCPVIVKRPAVTRPVESAMSDSQPTMLTVARISVRADALLSEDDSAIRDEPVVEVSIDAQDQEGARYGVALVP